MEAGLYVIGTPIGNLGDLTLRALETLREVDVLLAEDTRHSRKLLTHFDIHKPVWSCHKFNEASRLESLLGLLAEGKAVGLVSDSGMPGISDPGSRAIRAVREAGYPVTALPGPSAVTMAAALSGFGDDGFLFLGFLSHKGQARRNALEKQAEIPHALVLFESPHRLLKLLTDIQTVFEARPVFIGRELTKKFEECISGSAEELIAHFGERTIKGELVVVIAPNTKPFRSREKKAGYDVDTGQSR